MHPVRQNRFMIGLCFQQCPMQSNQLFHGKRFHPHGFRQSAVGQRFADNCLFIAHRCRQCIDQCLSSLRKATPHHLEKVLFICNLLRIRRSQLNLNHRRIDIRRWQKAAPRNRKQLCDRSIILHGNRNCSGFSCSNWSGQLLSAP